MKNREIFDGVEFRGDIILNMTPAIPMIKNIIPKM
jgi:hypothetical protein